MKKPVLLVMALVLVVGGVLVFVVTQFSGDSPAAAKAGECVVVTNQDDDRADIAGIGCASDNAKLKVGKVLTDDRANCPDAIDEYTSVVLKTGGAKLCLLPNFLEGVCYQPDGQDEGGGRSACAGEETVKVVKVISGGGDGAECPESDSGEDMIYPEPPITYCLSPVKP